MVEVGVDRLAVFGDPLARWINDSSCDRRAQDNRRRLIGGGVVAAVLATPGLSGVARAAGGQIDHSGC